jgi:hypothetical protein
MNGAARVGRALVQAASSGAVVTACLVVLMLARGAWGQDTDDGERFDQIERPGMEQIDRLNKALEQAGRIFVWVGAAVAALVVLKVASPWRILDSGEEWLVRRAVRDINDLLKRIQKEAEAVTEDGPKEPADEGLLAGMVEIAEFAQAEQVPSYVLTVNDLMLDNMRVALKRLRRSDEGDAKRYRGYMFSVLGGMKTLTEQSAEAGVASGLAVDLREYFEDEKRYKAWRKLLGRTWKDGNQEIADSFAVFMKSLKEGRPLVVPAQADAPPERPPTSSSEESSPVPAGLSEETLPAIQQAAARQARDLRSLVQTGRPPDTTHAWQFEFVRRQRQMHLRDEAQRMLSVFLNCERKSLMQVTKVRMLPCRAWGHVLHMLGADDTDQLRKRAEDRLLTIQEILLLEKVFLQTFARRESLRRIYGQGDEAELLMDMHLPEIRREALSLLRALHRTHRSYLDRATEALNEEETPQNDQVRKLIEHYVHRGHEPPNIGNKSGKGS